MPKVCHSPPPVPLPQWQRSARQGVTLRRGHRFTMALADSRITVCHQREAGTHNRGSSGTFRPRFRVRFPWLFLAIVCHAGMAHNRSGGAPPQCGRPGRGSNAHQSLAQPVSKRIAPSRLVALAWRNTGPPGAFIKNHQTKPINQGHLARKACPCVPHHAHSSMTIALPLVKLRCAVHAKGENTKRGKWALEGKLTPANQTVASPGFLGRFD